MILKEIYIINFITGCFKIIQWNYKKENFNNKLGKNFVDDQVSLANTNYAELGIIISCLWV